jgi:hypothetical protein
MQKMMCTKRALAQEGLARLLREQKPVPQDYSLVRAVGADGIAPMTGRRVGTGDVENQPPHYDGSPDRELVEPEIDRVAAFIADVRRAVVGPFSP